jgi:Mg/Co/Ni transporter MgtE
MNSPAFTMAIRFMEDEPEAAARKLEVEDPQNVSQLLQRMPGSTVKGVLRRMLPASSASIVYYLDNDYAADLFNQMSMADVVSILRHLSPDEREALILKLPVKKQTACNLLLHYPEYSVGAWVETDLLVLDESMQVEEALSRLKKKVFVETHDIYVVNRNRQVVGSLSIYALLRSPGTTLVRSVMRQDIAVVSALSDLKSALALPAWQFRDTLPVVSRHQEFIGILHHHIVRKALSQMRSDSASAAYVPTDILAAYGASFLGIIDTFFQNSSDKAQLK